MSEFLNKGFNKLFSKGLGEILHITSSQFPINTLSQAVNNPVLTSAIFPNVLFPNWILSNNDDNGLSPLLFWKRI